MINARSETISEKPSFKFAFKERRCIIPATGFYEWMKISGQKLPHRIYSEASQILGFAGIWESWKDEKGKIIQSTAIITKKAFGKIARIHDRQPAIIHQEDYATFLISNDLDEVKDLISSTNFEMDDYQVSNEVNSYKNNRPELIKPI